MNIINLDDLNQKILNTDMFGLFILVLILHQLVH